MIGGEVTGGVVVVGGVVTGIFTGGGVTGGVVTGGVVGTTSSAQNTQVTSSVVDSIGMNTEEETRSTMAVGLSQVMLVMTKLLSAEAWMVKLPMPVSRMTVGLVGSKRNVALKGENGLRMSWKKKMLSESVLSSSVIWIPAGALGLMVVGGVVTGGSVVGGVVTGGVVIG